MTLSPAELDAIRTGLIAGTTRDDLLYDLAQEQHDLAHVTTVLDDAITVRRAELDTVNAGPTPFQQMAALLEQLGVLVRENFSCCGTCLMSEIGDERDDSRRWIGYVAYHQQDTEDVIASGSAHVSFGIFPDAFWTPEEYAALPDGDDQWDAKALTMMREIVIPALEQHGMTVEWNGSIDRRPLVHGIEYLADIRGPQWDAPTDLDVTDAQGADDESGMLLQLQTSAGDLTFMRALDEETAAAMGTQNCLLVHGDVEAEDPLCVDNFLLYCSDLDASRVRLILTREDAETLGVPAAMTLHIRYTNDDDAAGVLATNILAIYDTAFVPHQDPPG